MIKINLLPYREILRKESIVNHTVVAVASLLAVILTIVIVDSVMRSKINSVDDNITRITKEIESNQVKISEINKLKKEKETYRRQLQVIENLKKSKQGPVRIMDDLATNVPERIWLKTLKQSGSNLELVGVAVDNKLISKFMSNLEKSPYFKKVELITTEMKVSAVGKQKEKLNNFTLTCLINTPSES